MHIHCSCRDKRYWLYLEIERIETDPITNDAEDEPYPSYCRTIRIKTTDGEVLELSLAADEEIKLKLKKGHLVTSEGLSVESGDDDPPVDWLTPQLYTGTAEDES